MCVLVEQSMTVLEIACRDIRLKGLAGRKRHTGVINYTGSKTPFGKFRGLGGKFLDGDCKSR